MAELTMKPIFEDLDFYVSLQMDLDEDGKGSYFEFLPTKNYMILRVMKKRRAEIFARVNFQISPYGVSAYHGLSELVPANEKEKSDLEILVSKFLTAILSPDEEEKKDKWIFCSCTIVISTGACELVLEDVFICVNVE